MVMTLGAARAGTPTVIDTYAGGGPTPASLTARQLSINLPQGVAVDSAGNLYVSSQGDSLVRMIDTSGNVTIVAGTLFTFGFSGDTGPATSALLGGPMGVAVDGAGNIYIADPANNCVRIVSGGNIDTFAGVGVTPGNDGDSGPAASAHLTQPTALAISGTTLYIADAGANVIRAVDLSARHSRLRPSPEMVLKVIRETVARRPRRS
jgi:sugar lactone lactonase YvrE